MPARISPERPDTPDAQALVAELEEHLASLYPSESRHGYSVEKLIAQGVAFFLIRHDGVAAGCGGIQLFGTEYGELKRMYVRPQFRGLGLASLLLSHLTDFAREKGVGLLRLETGVHQHAAISLYERAGFRRVPPFATYEEDPLSRCYEKSIAPSSLSTAAGDDSETTRVRGAVVGDGQALADIYNHYITHTIVTFEEESVAAAEMSRRLEEVRAASFPWLVAERAGAIVGYAYASHWRTRRAYRFSTEVTVYVAPDHERQGIGSMLYGELFAALQAAGIHAAMGGIALPNDGSVALHEKCGFRKVAHFEQAGFKFNRWIDVGYWQRLF